jgi:hypothetical protein
MGKEADPRSLPILPTHPGMAAAVQRERAVPLLDDAKGSFPLEWLDGPPGSGEATGAGT